MVLGEEGGLTDEMRDQFLAAGVTHIISISGSHLGMVAVLCFGFIRMLMRLLPDNRYQWLTLHADPKKIAAWLTLPLVIFYTLLAGGQTATVRSLVMVVAALSALILDREQALLHSLALAALLLLLVHPQALFDISFQLSFLSVFSIGSVVQLWNIVPFRPRSTVGSLARKASLLVLISLVAGLATGPLVVRYFNQFSLAGLLSNMVVVPFAGMVVVPLGLLSGILSLFTHQLPLAGLNQFAADLFLRIVDFFAGLPIAEFHPRSPGILWLVAYAVLLSALFIVVRNRLLAKFQPFVHPSRIPRHQLVIIAATAALLIGLTLTFLLPRTGALVSFPDVGQGDSALIQLPGNRNILIDGGGTVDERFDTGRRVLAPFLWNSGVDKLDLLVLSHPHPDHMNGLKFIVKKFDVDRVWTHEWDGDLPGYSDFLQAVQERRVPRSMVTTEDRPFMIGEAEVSVLHPAPSFRSRERRAYAAENDRSLVLRIAFRNRVLLFTGDIGIGAERWLLARGVDPKCDLLKVPHHGSKSSSSGEFLAAARPSLAIMTLGRGNRYRHPSPEVVEQYERRRSRIYRTDRDGALFININEKGLQGASWSERALRRIDPDGTSVLIQERENWKRVWLRIWEP